MVRSVKRVLSVTLKDSAPQVETLRCLLIEAANIINSRPLTHIPVDSIDAEPLTPNHFLLGNNNSLINTALNIKQIDLRKQYNILQQMSQCFWKRWIQEYLPELTRRTKWHTDVKPLKIDDLVLIINDNAPRGQWTRGIIKQVFPGPDGVIRTVIVRTSSGELRRPATKLARLDLRPEL